MRVKPPEELLDDVLRAIGLSPQLKDLKRYFPDTGQPRWHELIQIVEKLRDDGNIYIVKENNQYVYEEPTDEHYIRKSFKGIQFIANQGGYQEVRRRQLADAARQVTEAQRNKYLFWITASIGISTFVAALYYGLEIWKYFHCH
ncbi:MAG TPA: hypothetical protein VIJ92_15480 [Ginsengibacter sp.]